MRGGTFFVLLILAAAAHAMPIVRIPVTNTWEALGYPCTEIDAERLSSPDASVCVRYFDKFIDDKGYVQARSKAVWLRSKDLRIYEGENLFPKPFSTVDFAMVGEFGDAVELLPLRLVGEESLLCVATQDFRSLNRGYSQTSRYFLVPLVFLRLHRDRYIHSSDLTDRILRSYFVVSSHVPFDEIDKRDLVLRQFNVGERLPDWDYFQSIFQESFQKKRREEPPPQRDFLRSCVNWLLGRNR